MAEVFASAENFYPVYTPDLLTGKRAQLTAVTKLAAGINLAKAATPTTPPVTDGTANAQPNAVNGATTIWYQYCGAVATNLADTAATGGRIRYWDFTTAAFAINIIYFGTGVSTGGDTPGTATCNTYFTPAS